VHYKQELVDLTQPKGKGMRKQQTPIVAPMGSTGKIILASKILRDRLA
jgi:hypothetical protein